MAPDASGSMRKIPDDVRVESGWALARFGDGGWWPAVQRGLRGDGFEDEVVAALADAVRAGAVAGGDPPAWVTFVPSVRLGGILERLAQQMAAELGVPVLSLVARVAGAPAAVRDGQRRPAGRQRARRLPRCRQAPARPRRAAR